ncbi:MAG: metalloregulator ArsR/SmtB family transcription factor [Gammaproteobacteria bacterium]|nr:metalloregulator ArsR/SmtB family transcription factor [Gammaproteobacteria bacterium]MBU1722470.1 metalloregulator ArsR/SmtB family transcription factor [Gammaproteobacteria bacterium]MBU2005503.1 metalloregulator ArsR/SmtB family transcription factor [Gammaproteobacteria bacterium]
MHNQGYNITVDGTPMQERDIELASSSLKAASHPLRLKIMCLLKDTELTVHEIVEQVGTTQSNISQHLNILRNKGLLASRKDANRVYYHLLESRVELLKACSSLK